MEEKVVHLEKQQIMVEVPKLVVVEQEEMVMTVKQILHNIQETLAKVQVVMVE